MTEAELCKVEGTNEALDRPDQIVRPNIVLNPGRKQAGLITALAGLERAIRHKLNRTSTLKISTFLPSLVGQIVGDMREETSVRQVVYDMPNEMVESKERLDRHARAPLWRIAVMGMRPMLELPAQPIGLVEQTIGL